MSGHHYIEHRSLISRGGARSVDRHFSPETLSWMARSLLALLALAGVLEEANGAVSLFPNQVLSVGDGPVAIAIGDFNGDGIQDMVAANARSHDISALLGQGDGVFGPEAPFPAADGPDAVVTGDFNGDGHLDLAVSSGVGAEVVLLLGAGDGTFHSQ